LGAMIKKKPKIVVLKKTLGAQKLKTKKKIEIFFFFFFLVGA